MQGVGDGVGWHGRTQTCISLRLAYKIPAEPLRGTGWGCAPHTGGHSFMKRVTRKGRHVRFGQIPFIAHFRGGGRNHLLLSLLDNLRRLGCYTVRPLCRPEKGHRDLTSLSIVAVRAGWWVLKLVLLTTRLRVDKRRQLRKQQATIGFTDQRR